MSWRAVPGGAERILTCLAVHGPGRIGCGHIVREFSRGNLY